MKRLPESFEVEDSEHHAPPKKRKRTNKTNDTKLKRQPGKGYVSIKTKKTVLPRMMRKGCAETECLRAVRQCAEISEESRLKIFKDHYQLADKKKQGNVMAKELKTEKPKGRRRITHMYLLTHNGRRFKVCKNTFLDLGDKFSRVVLEKITDPGTVVKDKWGGRQSRQAVEREEQDRERIRSHNNRFPHVESHYCRASSTRRYLNSHLSLPKMYAMFLNENKNNDNHYFQHTGGYSSRKTLRFTGPQKINVSSAIVI